MSKKNKILVNAFTAMVIIGLVYILINRIDRYVLIKNVDIDSLIVECRQIITQFIILMVAILLLLAFNFLMWFKNLFGIPLTPEQAAERKRIKQERRKAALQTKLNKLN